MVQTRAFVNEARIWHPLEAWPVEQRAAALWPWLAHAGSLTEKLRGAAGNAFHVNLLREGTAPLDADDALLLHAPPGTQARLREVHLCGDAPWVYGRTLALADGGRWLNELGTQSLGERVFAERDTQRTLIEVAQLDAAQPLYRAAVQGMPQAPAVLWARRSVLIVRGNRLLVYECFLNGMRS